MTSARLISLLFIVCLFFSCDQGTENFQVQKQDSQPQQKSQQEYDDYNSQIIFDEIKKYNLQTEGEPDISEIKLPDRIDDNDPNWGVKAEICGEGGYDLKLYAGETLFFTSYSITEKCDGEPSKIWIISNPDKCICAYKSVTKESDLMPGIFSIDYPCSSAVITKNPIWLQYSYASWLLSS